MTKNILIEVIEKLQKICKKAKVRIAFTGGIAVGVYGMPRATYDVDGIILVEEKETKNLLLLLSKAGFKYDKKRPIKLIQGLPFITLFYSRYKMYIDLFIARDEFQENLLSRARPVKFNKIRVMTVSPEDLILLKLQAGRERDIEDVRGVISENVSKLDFGYLKAWAKKLRVDLFLKDELRSLGETGGKHG